MAANPEQVSIATNLRSISHGEEAEKARRARQAADISYLASSTALLIRIIEKRGATVARNSRLYPHSQMLISVLEGINSGETMNEVDLPYRQLIPLQIWNMNFRENPHLDQVRTELPQQLRVALNGGDLPPSLSVLAEKLDTLAGELNRVTNDIAQQSE